jgi:hypothetical protein
MHQIEHCLQLCFSHSEKIKLMPFRAWTTREVDYDSQLAKVIISALPLGLSIVKNCSRRFAPTNHQKWIQLARQTARPSSGIETSDAYM